MDCIVYFDLSTFELSVNRFDSKDFLRNAGGLIH